MNRFLFPKPHITYLAECQSTNDAVFEQLNHHEPTIIWTTHQTDGRGSRGRSWLSPKGTSLAFSIGWKHAPLPSTFPYPMWAGVVLHHAMEMCFPDHISRFSLKWPNDLLLNGVKTAGILCESRWTGMEHARTVVGIGINIREHALLKTLDKPWTTLEGLNINYDSKDLVHSLAQSFHELRNQTGETLRKQWEELAQWPLGISLKIRNGEKDTVGTYRGVTPSGALVIENFSNGQKITLTHAEQDFLATLQ